MEALSQKNSKPNNFVSGRADKLLAQLGLVKSRTLAQRLIELEKVLFNGKPITSSHELLEAPTEDDLIKLIQILPDPLQQYVSRGG